MCLLPVPKVQFPNICNTKAKGKFKADLVLQYDHLRPLISMYAMKQVGFPSASAMILLQCNSKLCVSESLQNLQFCPHSYLQPKANGYIYDNEMILTSSSLLQLEVEFPLKREAHCTYKLTTGQWFQNTHLPFKCINVLTCYIQI